jgi:hypothetical protein
MSYRWKGLSSFVTVNGINECRDTFHLERYVVVESRGEDEDVEQRVPSSYRTPEAINPLTCI